MGTMREGAREPLLRVESLSKHFGALRAVNRLSFSAFEGEVLGIGGPNGAGKTTLFEVISGMSPASAGRVVLSGADITRASPHEICHAGIARTFQLNASFETLTVYENVLVGAYFGRDNRVVPGLRSDRESRDRVERALEQTGLEGKRDLPARQLPVLDRKLLMLASALATHPRLLLMDEPVGGLNPGESDAIMGIVRSVAASGVTILVIEHVMRFLVQISTRVIILHHGEGIHDGAPLDLFSNSTVVDVYLGEGTAERLRRQHRRAGV